MPETSASFAAEFRRHLGELGFDAVLIGALAASRYRDAPRETTDIDFLARSLTGLADAMEAEGYIAKVSAFEEDGKIRVPGMARCIVGTKHDAARR